MGADGDGMSHRILILGAAGMLGHKLWQASRERHDTWATVRAWPPAGAALFERDRIIDGVTAGDVPALRRALALARPDAVVNCIGVIKQRKDVYDPQIAVGVNALWPHQVAAAAREAGARTIHVSTDCVFSGAKGRYVETDTPDATDLYGRSKLLGELTEDEGLTMRTSIIGRELAASSSLIEWFLAAPSPVPGFPRAWFSGLTTGALSGVILDVIERHPALTGLYHVAAEPIDKLTLLTRINEAMGLRKTIVPDEAMAIDRSLDASRFWDAVGGAAPSWASMIDALAADPTPYRQMRTQG